MAKFLGRAFLIKIQDDQGAFLPFAGMTAKQMDINNERIDATTPDPDTPEGAMWRETLAGTKSVDTSGDMTLVDTAAEKLAVALAMSDDAEAVVQIIVPSIGVFQGRFSIAVGYGDDGKLTGSVKFESTGKITFTAEA